MVIKSHSIFEIDIYFINLLCCIHLIYFGDDRIILRYLLFLSDGSVSSIFRFYFILCMLFPSKFRGKKSSKNRQTVLGHPFRDGFLQIIKRLASKLVKLLLLYSTVTCCLVTVEHVLSFRTSCSVKKFFLAPRAHPRICGCYLLSVLPSFFFIIIIACAPIAATQFSNNPS